MNNNTQLRYSNCSWIRFLAIPLPYFALNILVFFVCLDHICCSPQSHRKKHKPEIKNEETVISILSPFYKKKKSLRKTRGDDVCIWGVCPEFLSNQSKINPENHVLKQKIFSCKFISFSFYLMNNFTVATVTKKLQ